MKTKSVHICPSNSVELDRNGTPKLPDAKRHRQKEAQRLFLEGIQVRGEAAKPDADGQLPAGTLFKEEEGKLIRSRFSLV
jgi:hypothetical protein